MPDVFTVPLFELFAAGNHFVNITRRKPKRRRTYRRLGLAAFSLAPYGGGLGVFSLPPYGGGLGGFSLPPCGGGLGVCSLPPCGGGWGGGTPLPGSLALTPPTSAFPYEGRGGWGR